MELNAARFCRDISPSMNHLSMPIAIETSCSGDSFGGEVDLALRR